VIVAGPSTRDSACLFAVVASAVVLALAKVVFAVVPDQIGQGEAVVGGDEVMARPTAAGRPPLEIGAALIARPSASCKSSSPFQSDARSVRGKRPFQVPMRLPGNR